MQRYSSERLRARVWACMHPCRAGAGAHVCARAFGASGCRVVHGCSLTQVRTCEPALTSLCGSRSGAAPAVPHVGRTMRQSITASSVQPYSSALRCDAAFTDPSLNSTAAPSRSGNSLPRPIRQCPLRDTVSHGINPVSRGISYRSTSSAPAAAAKRMRWSLRAETAACARRLAQPRVVPPACASPRVRAHIRVCGRVCGVRCLRSHCAGGL